MDCFYRAEIFKSLNIQITYLRSGFGLVVLDLKELPIWRLQQANGHVGLLNC